MGRRRTIDREAVLDAAERVVARDGAANLTLDAVALEAGISKASVLYDAKTKQAVLEAVIRRAFQRDNDNHAQVERELDGSENLAVRGRISAAAEPPPEEFRPVALNLSAALTLDKNLRTQMQEHQAATIKRILQTSSSPRGALLAYLALEGLKFLEHLNFHSFSSLERSKIIQEISWLVNAQPDLERGVDDVNSASDGL